MANANVWGLVALDEYQEQVTEERRKEAIFFVLSVIRYLCQEIGKPFCPDLLDAMDEFNLVASPRLTDNIKKAIVNYITKRSNIMEFHSNETWKAYLESNESTLSVNYDDKVYLEYLCLNGYEKIIRSSENDNYASQITFHNAAVSVILQGYNRRHFSDASWKSLDDAARDSIDDVQLMIDMEIDR